ncbi:universal stress protein [Rhodovulum kholense]|uniref:Nucleotide-binding universal stress UspA family protein n=1 Tax=Rhodovulum kholense TaxID=453584 RepID=A0A8E3ARL6_9RHOB|nr:universal stress protein [Rhodovulum kholense]PTW51090.1 nucleotide-binding universal stress UspA family protein [Rhodovulum kholense]
MFKQILVPVDLAHAGRLTRACEVAGDLARHYGIGVTYVAVAAPQPGEVAQSPEAYREKLDAFAAAEAERHGHRVSSRLMVSPDPAAELDEALVRALEESGADLVVMASHVPGWVEHVFPSHGGRLASHAKASVLLVRP